MIAAIALNELRLCLRNGTFVGLAVAMLALIAGATALSVQRLATFDRERAAAEAIDREVWDGQGARNPHSAAHFARYAFKPVPQLAAFDPGVTDYAGLALWMEAHYQNPAVFRRAEDLGDAGRFGDLSPAWILQFAAPLFLSLILFSAIAGEREQGTLRQMAAGGIAPPTLLAGKLAGAGLATAAIVVPALIPGLPLARSSGGPVLPDLALRSGGLLVAYGLYFVAVGGIALGVSALCREKRTALIALVAIWAVSFVLLPRLSASLAVTLHPTPEAAELSKQLREASSALRRDTAYQEKMEREILAQYGVDKVEDLPINYGAYSLQQSEERAHPQFEAFYARLDAIHGRQENVIMAASILSPVLALETLSAGLAGADRHHQRAFAGAAEAHRRIMIKQLNDDLMFNAGEAGYGYTADATLWRQIDDFTYTPPRFASVLSHYALSALVLLLYAGGGIAFAAFALNRAQKGIAA